MIGRRASLVPLACAAALASGCPARPVSVGVVAPLSGSSSPTGQAIVDGVEIAHRQLSEDPDLPRRIVLEVRDSESDPEKAAELLRELYENGATVAIGGVTDPEARAMVPVLEEAGRVLISPSSTAPGLSRRSSLFFRIAPSGFLEGAKMGNFATQELKIVKVAILVVESPEGEGIEDVFGSEFERYGGEVAAVVEYPAGGADLDGAVAEALAAEPEAVYVAGPGSEIGRILERLEERGFSGRILTTSAFAAHGAYEQAGAAAEGVLLTKPVFDPASDDAAVRRFVDAYRAKHAAEPDFLAAQAYDAMMVVGAVLGKPEVVSSRDFYKELRNLRDFVGAAGPVQFDDAGDVGKFPRVYMVQGGELVDYETVHQRRNEILERLEELARLQREAARRHAAGGALTP